MIRRLEISGLVVIERAELDLSPGLVAITGETGAGKSVLMQSLSLLAGGAADASLVRPGHAHALVQATLGLPDGFWEALPEGDAARAARELVDDEHEIVVARRIPAEGRSRAMVEGQAVSRDVVASLMRHAVRFSAQGEQHQLISPRNQLAILDGFAGAGCVADARRLRTLRTRLREIDGALEDLARRRDVARAQRSALTALVDDVARLGADPEELEGLRAERERLRNADALTAAAAQAAEALSRGDGEGGALDAIGVARAAVDAAVEHDATLGEVGAQLVAAEAAAQEASIALRLYLDAIEQNPARLTAVEDRIDEYVRVERMHGEPIAVLIPRAEAARAELAALNAAVDDRALAEERARVLADASEVADRLHSQRVAATVPLARAVGRELEALAMGEATLRIELARDDAQPRTDHCTFWFQANPGLPEAPLADAASGGELSRVLLALHSVSAEASPAAWVFDEIDAGIGGTTANAVAERLALMGRTTQVIVITHLAAVAAAARSHFRLVKAVESDTTTTRVDALSGPDVEGEIVRMLGGASGARVLARRLLDHGAEA